MSRLIAKIEQQNVLFSKELENLPSKREVEMLATKEDLHTLATKKTLKNLATKTDVHRLPGMCDLEKLATHIEIQHLEAKTQVIRESVAEMMTSLLHVASSTDVKKIEAHTERLGETMVTDQKTVESIEGDIDSMRRQIGKFRLCHAQKGYC